MTDHAVECGRLVDTISPSLLWVTQDIQAEKKKTKREEDEKKKKSEEANDGWDSDYQESTKSEDDDDDDEEEEEEDWEEGEEEKKKRKEEKKKKRKEEKKKIRALGHDCTHFMYDAAMQKRGVCTHYLCVALRRKSLAKEKEEDDAAKIELRESKFKGIRRKLYGGSPKAGADSGEECSPLRSTASSEKGADSVFEDGEDEVFLMAAGSPSSKVLPQEG
jgi:hypothetical protein